MTLIDAIVLGLVQGITEFIPVSSSGHLVLTGHLLKVGDAFTFDVLLNFGTLLALIIYYRLRIWTIVKRTIIGKEWGLIVKLVGATIPAAVVGFVFSSQIESFNNYIWIVITTLFVIGLFMIFKGQQNQKADNAEVELSITKPIAAKIGFAQILAFIPGVSRSGITILAGLNSNLTATKAAEFSFLLAIPIIAGASLKTLLSSGGMAFVKTNTVAVLVGNIVSFVAGMMAINFLIKLLGKRGLKDFGYYRVGLAMVLVILVVTGII